MDMYKNLFGSLIVIGVICAWGVALLPVQASPATLPPRIATSTPTRLPATPTPTPVPQPAASKVEPKGATIVLALTFGKDWPAQGLAWQDLWTVVEWQDGDGTWHTVEGWQGHIGRVSENTGWTRWWLESDLFGQGPFRWVVYARPDGPMLAYSRPFDLPSQTGETVTVAVSLAP